MDPEDPNGGGLQAKDPNGVKSKKKQPGKVANTDQYGQGGAGGETAVPGKKSGTEHLPEGSNGKESHAAKNKEAGKSNPSPVLTPVQVPPPKDLPTQPKGERKPATAKGKGSASAPASGKKQARDVNHAAASALAEPRAQSAPVTPLPSEPAKLVDVPTTAPLEPVVVAPPIAKGKVDPLHDALRAEVSGLGEQIKTCHDAIHALSKQLQQTVATQLQTYAGSIDQRVQTGTKRVGKAYDGISTAITDGVAKANAEITKREKSIPAAVKAVRDAKADELKGIVDKVKADTTKAITQGPETAAAKKLAAAFADKMDAKSVTLVTDIKEKTGVGGPIAGKLDPKKYSSAVQVGGQAAYDAGFKALVEDKRLSLITTAGKSAVKLVEDTIRVITEGYRKNADKTITDALKGPESDLDQVITTVHLPEQQKNLDKAAALATETLQKQVVSARTGIAGVEKQATTRIGSERKTAEDGAHKAGQALSRNIREGAKEIENRIATKAAQDARSYSKLNDQLRQIGKSKKLDAPTKAKLDGMRADLSASHELHKQTLQDIATTSVDEMKREKEQQFEKAISEYEAAATQTKTELVQKMTNATTQLGTSFDTIGTSFDATVKSETEKMNVEFAFYTKEAHKLPETYGAKLDKMLVGAETGLKANIDQMLSPYKVQEKLNKESEPGIKKAMKTGPDDAQGLWSAMDGVGTSENKIFGILRKATPGEIIFIEGCYNDAYPKRGTGDYPSPLRADLDDELSGSEWDIAFSYLRHQREQALKLELDDSRGIFNDEEDRIEEVLKAAGDDELKNILQSEDGKAVLERVKGCLSSCDLDVVNALTATDDKGVPLADRKIKADAIRVYDAMYGGTGIGTDEDKIKQILESTTDPEQRKALHAHYNAYIRRKDPLQARILEQQSEGQGIDLMDASFGDEMSGGEWTETRALSEHELTQEEHLKVVRMAKVVDGAHGAGTDEDKIVDNLDDDAEYFEKYKKEKDPQKRKAMAEGREKAMNARLRWLEGERLDEKGNPLPKGPNMMTSRFKGESITEIIKGEMGSEDITFEELEQATWGPLPDRGDKNGQKLDRSAYQRRARVGALNLEYMVAQRKLSAGGVDPELLIAYACWGVSGTDEANLKKGVKKGSELYTKDELKGIRAQFKKCWGVDLMDGQNEIERKDFKPPTGVIPSEVDGKDWLEIRVALMGRPETPEEIGYVDNVRYKFVTTGTGSTSPWSHAREDMEENHRRVQDEVAQAVEAGKSLKSYDPEGKDKAPKSDKDPGADDFYKSDAATSGNYLKENRLEMLAGYAERSEMAFLEAKEAMADAIITVIELIGAALITAVSLGATSPMLAMFIGNLILAGMTIVMRKDMVGDAYGSESIGIDVVKGIVMAAIQAAGEAKVVADFAKKAGQYGGKFTAVFTGGAEKAGMRVVGKEGLEIAEQAALRLETKVGAKVATEGGEKAAVTAGAKEAGEKIATKEAGDVAEKVATKEAGDVAEKAATKEAGDVAEKAATKEAGDVAEKTATQGATDVAENAAASTAAKKTAAQKVESAVESGVKNATTTAMSDTAQFLMDEKTWEMKGFDAVFGPNSIGRKLLNSIPSAFVQGAVSDYIQNISNVPSASKVRGPSSGSEAVFRNIIAEVAGNSAGFFVYLDNYGDAGTFWQEFFKSNARSLASGGLTGYLMHRQRAVKAGRDFVEAFKAKDQEAIAAAMATVVEADGYMDTAEKQRLVDRITQDKDGADLVQHLPESFQQLAGKQKLAGANVTGPGGDTAPNTHKTANEEKKAVNDRSAATEEKKPAANDNTTTTDTTSADGDDQKLKVKKKPTTEQSDDEKKKTVTDRDVKPADDDTSAKKHGPDDDKPLAKTRDDHEKQIEKPDAETDEAARDRRSQALKPRSKDAKSEDWAHPADRKGVPEEVPLTRQELRDLVTEKYHATVEKYLKKAKTGTDPNEPSPFDAIIADLQKEAPGSIDKKKAEEYLARWGAAAKEVAAKTGHDEAELRVLYNVVEQDDFKTWFKKIEKLPKEQQAMMAHMWREELKLYVRDMMNNEKSKEVLYLRDLAMSGDRRGPKFDALVANKLKKNPGDIDAAYDGVMGSSKQSNTSVNKTITNSADGLDDTMAAKIRGESGSFTGQKKFDSMGRELVPGPEGKLVPKDDDPKAKEQEKAANKTDEEKQLDEESKQTPKGDEEKAADQEQDKEKGSPDKQAKPPVPPDKHVATDEQNEKGHAGVEVHSHFLGNVPDEAIKQVVLESVKSANLKKDQGMLSDWEPLLREIARLKGDHGELPHKRSKEDGKVTTRGVAGDAIEDAKRAVAEIAAAKREIQRVHDKQGSNAKLTDEQRTAKIDALKEKIELKAKAAVEKALAASDDTDFNSSYEIRDELIKKHFGNDERTAILGETGNLTNDALLDKATLQKLRDNFDGRPEVKAKLDRAEEIAKKGKRGPLTDEEKSELKAIKKNLEDQFSYDHYARETIRRLAEDNITYTEQSNSAKKLSTRFDEGQIEALKKQLIDEQRKILAKTTDPDQRAAAEKKIKQLENLQIAHLSMLNTSFFGERDDLGQTGEFRKRDVTRLDDKGKETPESRKEFEKEVGKVVKHAKERKDTAGVDIAGMEHFRFDEVGQDRMKYLFKELAKVGTPEEPIVLRPHVGEGAVDAKPGGSGHPAYDGATAKGGKEPSHYDRGRSNIDKMLDVFEQIAAENGGRLPPNVIVRFGHVTHATPEAAARMAKLGIIAEVNLTSNIKTHAVTQNTEGVPEPGKGEPRPNFPETLEDHSLPALIRAGAPIILSTDSHEVMDTNLPKEYERAKEQIERVRNNKQAIRVPVEEAQARGWPTHEGPPPHGTALYFQLNDVEKKRFDEAYDKLFRDANKYHENRPKQDGGRKLDPGDDGSQTPKTSAGGGGGDPPPDPKVAEAAKKRTKTEEQADTLRKLKMDLANGDDATKAKAKAEIDKLHLDPEWQDALKVADVFDTGVKYKENKGTDEERLKDSESLSKNIPAVMAELEKKKIGADPVLQQKRDKFERAVAMEILNNGSVRKSIDAELARLCDKAYDYILKTRLSDADQAKTLSDMHTDTSKGYGGGLRTPEIQEQVARGNFAPSAAKMLEVLKEGNIRERMLALQEFANIIGKDALSAEGRAKITAAGAQNTEGNKRQYSADDAKKLVERALAFEQATEGKDKKPANMFKPTMAEAADKHEDYAAAKAMRDEHGHEMDTKLPPMLQDRVNEFLGKSIAANPGQLTAGAENHPLARTTITVEEALRRGLQLSDREIEAAGGLKGELNWVVGSKANIVNENIPFIQDAKQNSMPLKAGISGTTYRWMQIVDMLGGDPKLARLAAVAALQAADAHSFHEIAIAAKGFGVDYNSREPYAGMAIPGVLEAGDLERLAKQSGATMAELNGIKKPDDDKQGP